MNKMQGGISLGRLYGIKVGLDWSWLFIMVLVTWNLAVGVFPALHPTWGQGLRWAVSIVAAILFFLSILAHELAHSLVAVWSGLPVRDIKLHLLGGVSNIEREPDNPKSEFLITIVGPITSLVLGILFLLLGISGFRSTIFDSGIRPMLASLTPVQTLLLWLGPVNIMLAVFNLVPGFPLDGGRVLRSLIWAVTKNFRLATQLAARFGQAIGWILIAAGFAMVFGIRIPLIGTGVMSGVWFVFIGWFLNSAADQSYRQAVVSDLLSGITVAQLMRRSVVTVPVEMTVDQMVDQYVRESDERAYPVVNGEELVGLACLSDIRKINRDQWSTTPVESIMVPITEVDTVRPLDDVSDALAVLSRHDIRQVLVVENGGLVGMLRRADIVHWLQEKADQARS